MGLIPLYYKYVTERRTATGDRTCLVQSRCLARLPHRLGDEYKVATLSQACVSPKTADQIVFRLASGLFHASSITSQQSRHQSRHLDITS